MDAWIGRCGNRRENVSSDHETQAVKGKTVARKTRMLDTHRFELGTVEDIKFDTTTGELTGSRLCSLGSGALIVNAE